MPSGREVRGDASALEREITNTNASARTRTTAHVPKWWKVRLFRGMINDVRRRAPYYWSDWVDAWDYRVVPATIYMYFAKCVCLSHLALSVRRMEVWRANLIFPVSYLPWLFRLICECVPLTGIGLRK